MDNCCLILKSTAVITGVLFGINAVVYYDRYKESQRRWKSTKRDLGSLLIHESDSDYDRLDFDTPDMEIASTREHIIQQNKYISPAQKLFLLKNRKDNLNAYSDDETKMEEENYNSYKDDHNAFISQVHSKGRNQLPILPSDVDDAYYSRKKTDPLNLNSELTRDENREPVTPGKKKNKVRYIMFIKREKVVDLPFKYIWRPITQREDSMPFYQGSYETDLESLKNMYGNLSGGKQPVVSDSTDAHFLTGWICALWNDRGYSLGYSTIHIAPKETYTVKLIINKTIKSHIDKEQDICIKDIPDASVEVKNITY